jgi:hypothetical protein
MESGACRDDVATCNSVNDETDNRVMMKFATVISVGFGPIREVQVASLCKISGLARQDLLLHSAMAFDAKSNGELRNTNPYGCSRLAF